MSDALKAAIPDLINSAAIVIAATGLPAEQRPQAIKSVIEHTLSLAGGIGSAMSPEFAPLINAGIQTAISFIENAAGANVTAADIAEASKNISEAHANNQTEWPI